MTLSAKVTDMERSACELFIGESKTCMRVNTSIIAITGNTIERK